MILYNWQRITLGFFLVLVISISHSSTVHIFKSESLSRDSTQSVECCPKYLDQFHFFKNPWLSVYSASSAVIFVVLLLSTVSPLLFPCSILSDISCLPSHSWSLCSAHSLKVRPSISSSLFWSLSNTKCEEPPNRSTRKWFCSGLFSCLIA